MRVTCEVAVGHGGAELATTELGGGVGAAHGGSRARSAPPDATRQSGQSGRAAREAIGWESAEPGTVGKPRTRARSRSAVGGTTQQLEEDDAQPADEAGLGASEGRVAMCNHGILHGTKLDIVRGVCGQYIASIWGNAQDTLGLHLRRFGLHLGQRMTNIWFVYSLCLAIIWDVYGLNLTCILKQGTPSAGQPDGARGVRPVPDAATGGRRLMHEAAGRGAESYG